jgi:hypothetical protein
MNPSLGRALKRTKEQLELSYKTIATLARGTSHERLTSLRDGPAGWTTLEVVCHMRDIEVLFHDRIKQTLAQENPEFPHVDQDAWAVERRYNEQELERTLGEWHAEREALFATIARLQAEDLERTYVHPLRGPETLLDLVLNVVRHDLMHIEQISRVLNP